MLSCVSTNSNMVLPFVTHQGPYQDTYFVECVQSAMAQISTDLIVHHIPISLTFTMHHDQARFYFFAKCPDGTPLMTHYVLEKAHNIQEQLLHLFTAYYQMRNGTTFMADTLPSIVPTVPGMPPIQTSMVCMPTASVTSLGSPTNVTSATTPDFVDTDLKCTEAQI